MHDAIYENQDLLSPALLIRLGQRLGLDMQRFNDDVASHRFLPRVKQDFMSAVRSGAAGTPSFFINGELTKGHHVPRPRAH